MVKYDAMCSAIALCSRVDEAKEIRDKARALEVYAKQARNREAERKAGEIRIRAERRAGQLLREMKENGQRASAKENLKQGPKSRSSTSGTTLTELGISRDQSSQWQRLAEIPEQEFEEEIQKSGGIPCTEGMLNARILDALPKVQMDPNALWTWGRIKDFERIGILDTPSEQICAAFTVPMREDVERILPRLIDWLKELRKSCGSK